jgi:catechol 2,3-dioxygenase-like lactoylglutathione lyase family enzyme
MKIRHYGLSVTDESKALRFYRDLLGFKIVSKAKEDANYAKQLLGVVNIEYIKLKLDDDNPMLELFIMPRDRERGKWNHISLLVDDVEKMYQTLEKEGVKFISKPILDTAGKHRLCFCKDNDNNLVELVQELETQVKRPAKPTPNKPATKIVSRRRPNTPQTITEEELNKEHPEETE